MAFIWPQDIKKGALNLLDKAHNFSKGMGFTQNFNEVTQIQQHTSDLTFQNCRNVCAHSQTLPTSGTK